MLPFLRKSFFVLLLEESSINTFENEPSSFFFFINMVNPSTALINLPSFISEVKKSILEFF